MSESEKYIIISKAREIINLLSNCDDGAFVDSIVYAINDNDETSLDFI